MKDGGRLLEQLGRGQQMITETRRRKDPSGQVRELAKEKMLKEERLEHLLQSKSWRKAAFCLSRCLL